MQQAFGKFVLPVYYFDKAKVIVSLDDNFLMDGPGSVRYARDFADGRRIRPSLGQRSMSRLYVAESTPSITGAVADVRVRSVKPSEIVNIARAIQAGNGTDDFTKALVADLAKNRGAASSSPVTPSRRKFTRSPPPSTTNLETSARPSSTSSRSKSNRKFRPNRFANSLPTCRPAMLMCSS